MRVRRFTIAVILAGSILGGSASTFAWQRNSGQERSGGGGQARPSSPPSHTPPASHTPTGGGNHVVRQPPPPPIHAQRETVRTPNFVPRVTGGNNSRPTQPVRTPGDPTAGRIPDGQTPGRTPPGRTTGGPPRGQGDRQDRFPPQITPRRPIVPGSATVQAQRRFTKTAEGRRYDNGVILHRGRPTTTAWQRRYFPRGHYHFPFYRTTFVRGECYPSPFVFFFGVCVPYIAASECRIYPPAVVFIDVPVFRGDRFSGFEEADDGNLFNDPNLEQEQPGLLNAIDELREAFLGGNIDDLVTLIDPNTSIAVYEYGHYQYSLSANDYIDLSRDAMLSMRTTGFNLTYLHERAPGVFAVGGRQSYLDQNGQTQITWVSYVLQDIGGQWTLTQVGAAPDVKRPR